MFINTVVITGANRGIGLELVKQYVAEGCHVVGLCRTGSEALEQTGASIIEGIEVTNNAAIQQVFDQLKNTKIDLLINCAGILNRESLPLNAEDFNDIQKQFEVNAIGPLKITNTLLPLLKEGSKIAMITSRMGSIDDNTSGGRYGYRMSKTALNAASKSLAVDLQEQGIAVGIFHPGWVRTEMVGFNGLLDPDESAAMLKERISELSLETTGKFFHANGEELPY